MARKLKLLPTRVPAGIATWAVMIACVSVFAWAPSSRAAVLKDTTCLKSFASVPRPADVTPELFQQLKIQVCQSFAEKFSKVSSDIPASSRMNLERISSALKGTLGEQRFKDLWLLSSAMLEETKSRLVIQSETTIQAATSILSSGAFFSRDELIRKKLIPFAEKMRGATRYNIDGVIGQQDTVFLAIKPKEIHAKKVGNADYIFGEVNFLFTENVLNQGYFTMYPFDNSPDEFYLRKQSEGQTPNFTGATDLYKKFLFTGKSAFDTLIRLSLVQTLSQSADSPLPQEVLGAYPGFPIPFDLKEPLKHIWSFWELKVPVRLTLRDLSAIQLRKTIPAEDIRIFAERAKEFAEKNGSSIRITEGFDQYGYALSVARGAYPNRAYYEFVRIDFQKLTH